MTKKEKFKIGGLCSGVGGIELGFRQAGFDIAWANDMDEKAMITYQRFIGKNHYLANKAMTINEALENHIDKIKRVDVLAAGFPCQAFSVAGKRRGFEDARGTVIWDIINFAKVLEAKSELPKVIFLENVKNFKTHDTGNTYETIERKLYDMNYSVYTKVLNTCDYSEIPQNRERTYMVCFKNEKTWEDYKLHDKNDNQLNSEVKETLKVKCPITYTFHRNFPGLIDKKELKAKNEILNIKKSPGKIYTYWKKDKTDYVSMLNDEYAQMGKNTEGSEDTFYQIRRVYARANKSNLCPTLTANMGTGGHNVPLIPIVKRNGSINWRKLTPKECFALQGYPNFKRPNYKDVSNGQLYKQAGNSVSVPVIRRLAESIKKALDKDL